jgi:uncharacterized delta-60 repeat protein
MLVESLEARRLLAVTVPGDFDTAYGAIGKTFTPYVGPSDDVADAIAWLNDPFGRFVVASNSWHGEATINLSRYSASGALDTSFGSSVGGQQGTVKFPALPWRSVADMVVNADGSMTLLASAQQSGGLSPVQRVTSDGALDARWVGPGSAITGTPQALASLADGRTLVVTGTMLARLNADGTLDTTFGSNGKVVFPVSGFITHPAFGIAVQTDGSILLAGERANVGQAQRQALVRRYTRDGAVETSFGVDGSVLLEGVSTTASSLRAITVQADGKIVVAGYTNTDSFVARLTTTGAMDSGFAAGGVRVIAASATHADKAYNAALGADGAIFVGGNIELINNQADDVYGPYLAKLTDTGALDAAYDGNGIIEQPLSVLGPRWGRGEFILDSGNKLILAAGRGLNYNSNADVTTTRFTATGALDTAYGTNGATRDSHLGARQMPDVGGSFVQPDGKLIRVGAAQHVPGSIVVHRFNANGTADTTFGGGTGKVEYDMGAYQERLRDVIVQPDGKLLLVGGADFLDDELRWDSKFVLMRLTATGNRDATFGSNGVVLSDFPGDPIGAQVARVALLGDGRIMVAGRLAQAGQDPQQVVLRYSTTGLLDTTYGVGGVKAIDLGGTDERIAEILPSGSGVVLAGSVRSASGNVDRFIARLDESGNFDPTFGVSGGVSVLDAGANEEVVGLVVDPVSGALDVGGVAAGSIVLTRLSSGGVPNDTFASAGTAIVPLASGDDINDMIRTPDGAFVFTGSRLKTATSDRDALLARLTPAGALDSAFGEGGFRAIDLGTTQDIGIDVFTAPLNRIVVAGMRGSGSTWEWMSMQLLARSYNTLNPLSRDFRFVPDHVFHFLFADDILASADATDLVAYNVTTGQRLQNWKYYESLTGFGDTVIGFMLSSEIPVGKYVVTIPAEALSDRWGPRGPFVFEMYVDRGTVGNDDYTLKQEGSTLRITRAPAAGSAGAALNNVIDNIWNSVVFINGGWGNDTVTVDYRTGDMPGAWLDLNGGGGANKYVWLGDNHYPDTFVGMNSSRGFGRLAIGDGEFRSASALPKGLELDVLAGATLSVEIAQQLGDVTIAGAIMLKKGGATALSATSLTFTGQGSLNLEDNDLVVNYSSVSPVGIWTGSQYDGISGMIQSGRIRSAAMSNLHGLAVAEAREVLGISGTQTASFAGFTVDSTSVLVKYTYAGDANLDGKINIDDYGRIDGHVSQSGSVFGWFNGDFNYDGKINIDDYGIIDGAINAQGAPL